MTRAEARERFFPHSGLAYQDAEYRVDKEAKEVGGADDRERACFWEIWHKPDRRVVWVAHGCEDILDESDPHLELKDFFLARVRLMVRRSVVRSFRFLTRCNMRTNSTSSTC